MRERNLTAGTVRAGTDVLKTDGFDRAQTRVISVPHDGDARALTPFTYLVDTHGLVLFYDGWGPDPRHLCVKLVYFPDSSGDHIDTAGNPLRKHVFGGTWAEMARAAESLPAEVLRRMSSMQLVNDGASQHLAVDSREIVGVFDPRAPIRRHLSSRMKGTKIGQLLTAAIDTLDPYGVTADMLGVYGGLQCGISRKDGIPRDLDLLVYGVDNYDHVVAACSGFNVDISRSILRNPNLLNETHVLMRRASISRLVLSDGTPVDLRIVRDDINDYEPWSPTVTGDISMHQATVTESRECLSLPTRYSVSHRGQRFEVASRYYHHLGAAHRGDTVCVSGTRHGANVIVLSDPDRHHILGLAGCSVCS